jgi:pimeloyl-ACP methyl ester carboxylesterase
MRKRLFLLICFFCIAYLFVAVSTGNAQSLRSNSFLSSNHGEQAQVPRFESSSCAVQIPTGVKAECGNLFVPENRSKPNSRTIRLAVIIIKSTSQNPAPDPVFYTGGGPGGSSLGRARGAKGLEPYTRERDFIIFEQRGTGYVEPSLPCPEVNNAQRISAEQNLSAKQALQKEVLAAKECHDRLIRENVDLSAYDSAASAADMEDLRHALGIKQWNLYGISYSTRLMLNYIREYPQGVRSVILDSVLPPTVNYDETSSDAVVHSLNILFDHCSNDAKCSTTYPKLKNTFYAVLKTANKNPIVVNVTRDGKTFAVKLDGNAIVDLAYNLLEDTGALAQIPSIIQAISKGNYEALKPYAENKIKGGGFIWGMRYSVWCREEMPFQDRRKIAAQATKHSEMKGFNIQGAFPDICKVWNVPAASAIENQPVKSNIPAMIFSGEYDPDTPPAWGKLVASWFPNSYFYEVKSTSHGVLFGNRCAIEMAATFLNNPTSKPDATCLSKISPIDFK